MILQSTTRGSSRALPGRRDPGRRIPGRHVRRLALQWLEDRVLLSSGLDDPISLPIGSWAAGGLGPGGADFYRIEPTADGLLTALAHSESATLQLRLSLYDAAGHLLVQSDGQSLGDPDPMIAQHLLAGAAEIEVQSLSGSGTFALSTSLTPSSDPSQTVGLPPEFQGTSYAPIAVGDFTNDGILDIVAPDGVHLGTGDGTFGPAPAGGALADSTQAPAGIAVGDFNGDGNLDAAVALSATDSVSISMGNGDGTFRPATTFGLPPGGAPDAIVAGDFGTGHTDLAVADSYLNVVYILQGNGDGTFDLAQTVPVGQNPVAIAEGDFAGDGRTDLAVADHDSGDITVLINDGDGTFTALAPIALPAGATPTAIVAGDFGTGHLDLAVADSTSSAVDLLAGDGDGRFRLGGSTTIGSNPWAIVAGDFTGDGRTDLAVANANSNNVSVLLGNGDGMFQPALYMAAGATPLSIVAGDFNRDDRLDLATGNAGSNDISVLLGKGDGTFQERVENLVGEAPAALATGDFTGNGNLGLAVVDQGSADITILPGNGDGTFQRPLTVPLPPGSDATGIVAGDFNGDGRTDLAVADSNLGEVDILLGNGDGTFQAIPPIPVAGGPYAIAMGDFTGNGRIDLAVADRASNAVTILLNNGDGTFRALAPIVLGPPNNQLFADAIVAGHFVEGGPLDLAVAEPGADSVAILVGNGDGTFQLAPPISLGDGSPSVLSMVAGDFAGDGRTSLAVAATDYANGDSVEVLLGNGDGTCNVQPPMLLSSSTFPVAVVAGDFNGDGKLDVATADQVGVTDDYSIYLNNGDGTFQPQAAYALGGPGESMAIATGDFAGDGRTDLAIARTGPDDVAVRLGNGDGTFSDPAVTDLVRRQTPVVGDLNGDGAPDVSVVDAAGDILFRAGRPGKPGSFAPPLTVNPGDPSRDIAFVQTGLGPLIASVDANDDALSFFGWGASGFARVASLPTGPQPAQIVAADLDGTGRTDLIVRNAGDGTLSIYMADGRGWFLPPVTLSAGRGASDVEAAALRPGGLLDLVVTNRLSGEVEVLRNLGNGAFAAPVVEQAGRGPYGSAGSADPTAVTSLEGTSSVTSGVFTPGGLPSLVALDPGSNDFGLLSGLGDGRLSNAAIFPTPSAPLVVRAVDFNGDGLDGLAILTAGGLYIERSDGHGGFLPPTQIDVGFEPNGLTVADLNGDGKAGLLVSNPRGDLLVLLGQGDGTFSAPKSADQQVSLAVVGPSGSIPGAFVFADQLTDRVIVRTASGGVTVLADTSTGLVSPGAVKLADLNGDGIPDLIVADSGSNDVLVYPGLGDGAFGPALNDGRGFFTGTDPVGITVADVTGNGRPDLIVANKGSNTVSILINEPVGDGFTFVPGPSLDAGVGPVATAVVNLPGSPLPGLLVADSGSNDVRLLQGLGNGSFNDQVPTIYPVGVAPSQLYVGPFTSAAGPSLATINSGSNTVTVISGLGSGAPTTETIPTGGIDPTAGLELTLPGSDFASLMVANSADGNMSLLTGGAGGLALSSIVSSPGVPNPSGLALAGFSGGELQWYATSEGEASATLLALSFEGTGGVTPPGAPTGSSPGPGSPTSAQLVSLNETSLALVGTLLTISLNSTIEGEQAGGPAGTAAAATGPGPSAGQGPFRPYSRTDQETDEFEDLPAAPAAGTPAGSPWARYVTGIDQALEELRDGADERLRQERAPDQPVASPGQTRLDRDGATRPTDGTTERGATSPGPNPVRLVDAAMASLAADPRAAASPAGASASGGPNATIPAPDGPAIDVGTSRPPIADPPHRTPIRAAMSVAGAMAMAAAAARARQVRSRNTPDPRWDATPSALPGTTGRR